MDGEKVMENWCERVEHDVSVYLVTKQPTFKGGPITAFFLSICLSQGLLS